MSDPAPTPNSTPNPTPTPRSRGDINQAWLDELTNAESISAAAQKTAYAAQLANGDLDATKPAGSVKIRVETVAYYLERSSAAIIASKKMRTAAPQPQNARNGHPSG